MFAISYFISNPEKRRNFHVKKKSYIIWNIFLTVKLQLWILKFYCSVFIASWSGVIKYHGARPTKRTNQVFVANHTTVYDIVVLSQIFSFSIVGQKHPGIMGIFFFLNHLSIFF